MAPVVTVVRRNAHSAITGKVTGAAKEPKRVHPNAVETDNDVINSLPSPLESDTEDPPRSKTSNCMSNVATRNAAARRTVVCNRRRKNMTPGQSWNATKKDNQGISDSTSTMKNMTSGQIVLCRLFFMAEVGAHTRNTYR